MLSRVSNYRRYKDFLVIKPGKMQKAQQKLSDARRAQLMLVSFSLNCLLKNGLQLG